jgi:hypothetical protein
MSTGCWTDALQLVAIVSLAASNYYSLQCYRIARARVERMEVRLKALEERQ